MTEEQIKRFEIADILNSDNLYTLQEQPIEMRAIFKALIVERLQELQATREIKDRVKEVFKAFEQADKELSKLYTLKNAKSNASIPLVFDANGKPLPTIDNFLMILQNDPTFKDLKFNLLAYSPERIKNGKLERWEDKDDSWARFYIEKNYKIHNANKLDDALRIVFAQKEYHPVKEVLEATEWDGVSRIYTLFEKWLKCEQSDYTKEVTRLVFTGGIHRLYNPGCKFDDVAVLIGTKQGEGKSTFVRWLAMRDDFFTEVTVIEGQKGIEAIEGAWICEIAELLAVTKKTEVEAVKTYMSKLVDRYRRPFDKRTTDHKRKCVFIGTTNKEQFLTDKTGNRRWYPLKVNTSGYDLFKNQAEVKNDIRQAWAEAKVLYDKGELKPFADEKLIETIRTMQAGAVEDDYRVGLIEKYLQSQDKVCSFQIWKYALNNEYTKPTKRDSNEISLIMQGFPEWVRAEKQERHHEFGKQRFWEKKYITDLKKLEPTDLEDLAKNY